MKVTLMLQPAPAATDVSQVFVWALTHGTDVLERQPGRANVEIRSPALGETKDSYW